MAATRWPRARTGALHRWAGLHPSGISECVICGPAARGGLRVRFRRRGDAVIAAFTPRRAHQGYHGLMSGGLLAAIFDCLHYRIPVVLGVVAAVTARTAESRAVYVDVAPERLPSAAR